MAIFSSRRRAASIFWSRSSAIGDPLGGNLADNLEVLGGMLPHVDALFTLVRELARRLSVSEIAAPKSLVQRHGLAAMAARAGAASYRDDLVRATVQWAQVEQQLPPLVTALVRAGVSVAPIKGVAYAKTIYASPAERPMGDIDLLVPERQLAAARAVLREAGFTPAEARLLHHAEAWTKGNVAIDLHWNIIAAGRARIGLDEIWSRAKPGWPLGALRLEADDALVFHLIHFARNRLRLPLMNVVDTARLLESANVDTAIERASTWGVGRAVRMGLRFCNAILNAQHHQLGGWLAPSAEEIAHLREPSSARKLVFDVATAGSVVQLGARTLAYVLNTARSYTR
jgi:hypothetical protein